MTPRVSVCMPVFEASTHLRSTLASIWDQDYAEFEVVAIDDGSTDATPAILGAERDPRLRVFRREHRGQAITMSEAIGRARGDLVKFLDADDLLRSDCLGKMVAALDAHADAAFVFSRREILVDPPDDPSAEAWLRIHAHIHRRLGEIGPVNQGSELLRRCLRGGLAGNWVAEPAGVMARRADLIAVGGYSLKVRQTNDMELWLRLMTRGDVLYLDEPLCTYRYSATGVTGQAITRHDDWLDALWTAEALAAMAHIPEPRLLRRVRRSLIARALRWTLSDVTHRRRGARAKVVSLAGYARHRLARRRPALHVAIPAGLGAQQ
jgi:glycosyltransferase involved in cell wall biosynthesis